MANSWRNALVILFIQRFRQRQFLLQRVLVIYFIQQETQLFDDFNKGWSALWIVLKSEQK